MNKTIQYYKLKYGRLVLNYYDNENCLNNINETIEYPISNDEDENELLVLKEDNLAKNYPFSFDYFSSTIFYSNSTGDDEDDDDDFDDDDDDDKKKKKTYKRSLTCNGLCYKRLDNSDIILPPDTQLIGDYNFLSNIYKYYSCIYNNIIKTATIDITFYEDKECKNLIMESKNNGSNICWKINDNFSFRPLYYEDNSKKLYYHSYNTDNCISKYIDYFVINEQYLECNSKCNLNKTDSKSYYKCIFKANKQNIIKQKTFLLFLYLILLFKIK